ncbi:MAG TPA: hypothetical protein VJ583_06870 [Nitrososphaeraceae archaeon]|nr:hypothetical protein [Nitrososphaeraceae archaeon]
MIKISRQNGYIHAEKRQYSDKKECSHCEGVGWIYEFYNDPVSWRICPYCCDDKRLIKATP